jgi:hypothetical protein
MEDLERLSSPQPKTNAIGAKICEKMFEIDNLPFGTHLPGRKSDKVRNFACASWKWVRIFEGIFGVFQDAHLPNMLRTFEQCAHLRRAMAGPWPCTRCR